MVFSEMASIEIMNMPLASNSKTNATRVNVFLALTLAFFCFSSCNENTSKKNVHTETAINLNDEIEVYDFEAIEPLLNPKTDKIHLINFWAMWCAPCVEELPILQRYANEHPEVELLFVSLDFSEDIEMKLKPFLKTNKITSSVVLLDDPNSNNWIDKIDPNWSGALPLTIICNDKTRHYVNRPFKSISDLQSEIKNIIKN